MEDSCSKIASSYLFYSSITIKIFLLTTFRKDLSPDKNFVTSIICGALCFSPSVEFTNIAKNDSSLKVTTCLHLFAQQHCVVCTGCAFKVVLLLIDQPNLSVVN